MAFAVSSVSSSECSGIEGTSPRLPLRGHKLFEFLQDGGVCRVILAHLRLSDILALRVSCRTLGALPWKYGGGAGSVVSACVAASEAPQRCVAPTLLYRRLSIPPGRGSTSSSVSSLIPSTECAIERSNTMSDSDLRSLVQSGMFAPGFPFQLAECSLKSHDDVSDCCSVSCSGTGALSSRREHQLMSPGSARTSLRKLLRPNGVTRAAVTVAGAAAWHLRDSSLQRLCALSCLQHLRLVGVTALSEDALAAIGGCTSLTSLTLVALPWLGAQSLEAIGALPQVQVLRVVRCPAVSDQALLRLTRGSGCKKLTELVLAGCSQRGLGDEGIAALGALRSLRKLSLDGCRQDTLSDLGIAALLASNALQLSSVSLRGCTQETLGDGALVAAACCSSLTSLHLDGCTQSALTGRGVAALAKSPSLRELSLKGCSQSAIDDESLRALARSSTLQLLDLRGLHQLSVTSVGFAAVAEMHGLEGLRLSLSRDDVAGSEVLFHSLSVSTSLSRLTLHLQSAISSPLDGVLAKLFASQSLEKLTIVAAAPFQAKELCELITTRTLVALQAHRRWCFALRFGCACGDLASPARSPTVSKAHHSAAAAGGETPIAPLEMQELIGADDNSHSYSFQLPLRQSGQWRGRVAARG